MYVEDDIEEEWLTQPQGLSVRVDRHMKGRRIFLGIFVLVFALGVASLAQLDLLPTVAAAQQNGNALGGATNQLAAISLNAISPMLPELPTKIEIPKINLSATIANPTTTDIDVLDKDLLSGAVRYPTSARLGETGNVVLFGHSSYLPIVGNQAYKTFDGIQKLVAGDTITVYSSDMAYTYQVESVPKRARMMR